MKKSEDPGKMVRRFYRENIFEMIRRVEALKSLEGLKALNGAG